MKLYVKFKDMGVPVITKGQSTLNGWWYVYHPNKKEWQYVQEHDVEIINEKVEKGAHT